MEAGQILHITLTIAAFVIALRAYSDVRALRKALEAQTNTAPK